MADAKTAFWTPRTVAVVIGAVLLVVALAVLVSLPQNNYHPCDLLEPTYAGDAELGFWMVDRYDPEIDVYHLLVVMEHPNGTYEWLDGDGICVPVGVIIGAAGSLVAPVQPAAATRVGATSPVKIVDSLMRGHFV